MRILSQRTEAPASTGGDSSERVVRLLLLPPDVSTFGDSGVGWRGRRCRHDRALSAMRHWFRHRLSVRPRTHARVFARDARILV